MRCCRVAGRGRTAAVKKHIVGLQVTMQYTLAVDELQAADNLYGEENLSRE
jgi:hypothetical protein